MSLRTRKLGRPNIAFLLNEKRFRQLVEIIEELTDSDNLEYTVRLSDSSSITCDSADEVLRLQNSRERQIRSIWIESPYNRDPHIEVKFVSEWYTDPIEYQVAGNDRDVFHASARLEEFFSGLRQWNSILVNAGWKLLVLYCIALIPLVFSSLPWVDHRLAERAKAVGNSEIVINGADGPTLEPMVSMMVWLVGGTLFSALILAIYFTVRRHLLPNGTFAIGDGVERHDSLVRTRRVIGGIVLTLVLGAVGYILYPFIFPPPEAQ